MDFKTLFKNERQAQQGKSAALLPGETFPMSWHSDFYERNVLFAGVFSLYCSHCIDLLPELVEAIRNHRIPFALITNGSVPENMEIAEHFKTAFPIASIEENEIYDLYKVIETPYFYKVHASGEVLKGFKIESGDDLASHWKEHIRLEVNG
ncbi:hypothetical protein [Cohnella mopanensis]|uniref:hypothetical protein n=1 Tax=Cohnella mopanensis TaxID=2911966 RepID=UPI001EF88C2F|nr:hypothetical protein [Cohnella mopanensis]